MRISRTFATMSTAFLSIWGSLSAAEGERTAVRLLYGFEEGSDAKELLEDSEHVDIITVQDNGVTEGRNCARLTFNKGAPWAHFTLGENAIQDWSDFDYFALDLYAEDKHPYRIVFELWDQDSRNYATRCTWENTTTHPGPQTLMWQINRAKRNSKEGREWHELEPEDKIDLDNLKMVKIFMTPLGDRDAVFWVDNFRLLQEDAAKPKMKLPLPANAIAFDFGSAGAVVPGFDAVEETTEYDVEKGFGFSSVEGLSQDGKGWPDLLSGKFVWAPDGGEMEFRARVPDGDYRAWLCAGMVIRPEMAGRPYLLRLNDQILTDQKPSVEEFCSEKYLYRFMWTQYSERPHALWLNYINRMYPVIECETSVTGGELVLSAKNHFLCGLILVPKDDEAGFNKMSESIRRKRIETFEKTYYTPEREKPERRDGDGDYILFVPASGRRVMPWSGPTEAEREVRALNASGAPGQSVVMRLAVTPFADLGSCSVSVSDLTGPGRIPSSNIKVHYKNYRSDGAGVVEMALLPSRALNVEKGVSHSFWLWLRIPEDAQSGHYNGSIEFLPRSSTPSQVPVELEVYPFRLEPEIPVSYGMYYSGRRNPAFPEHLRREKLKEHLQWMRDIGFTATAVGGPRVRDVNIAAREVSLDFSGMELMMDLAAEVGMAKRPEQELMATSLGTARAIGRRLPGSLGAKVDQNPGIELRQPEFRALHMNALHQYKAFLNRKELPVAVEVVDEPREVPNPWNRNLADSIAYADMLNEAGIRCFITPMGDSNHGKDYTVLAEHVDIVSVHAYPGSRGFIQKARKLDKTLWFYNTGKDRYSWGFYNWRMGSRGRWEWHFCWAGGSTKGGYPGREWYNPFTDIHGLAPNAPYHKYPGGMLYQSAYLDILEGVNDYRYLYTLERALEATKAEGSHPEVVKEAEEFLAALRRAIPEFPKLKGIASEEDGALLGMGMDGDAQKHLPEWRARIAGYLRQLKR